MRRSRSRWFLRRFDLPRERKPGDGADGGVDAVAVEAAALARRYGGAVAPGCVGVAVDLPLRAAVADVLLAVAVGGHVARVEGPPRNPFLVKLYFGSLVPAEEIAAHIRARRERIAAELAELEELERTIDREASPYGFLALQYGLEVDRAIVRWADEALNSIGDA
jgi:hypothetical protein